MSSLRVLSLLAIVCALCVVSVSASRQFGEEQSAALQPVTIEEAALTPEVTLVATTRDGEPMLDEPAVSALPSMTLYPEGEDQSADEPVVSAPTTPAAAPTNCATVLSVGCKGAAVLAVQNDLIKLKLISKDGATSNYTPTTAASVTKFQVSQGLKPADGKAGPITQAALKKAANAPPKAKAGADGFSISPEGREQMANLLATAKKRNNGPYAYYGKCFEFVWKYLMAMKGSYGKMSSKNQPPSSHQPTPTTMGANYARYFADYFNQPKFAAQYGIQKLNIKNAYDAPPGSIVVVGPGTPGTGHPYAGDITVSSDEKMGSDSYGYAGCKNCHYFINDASRMNYGDPRQFVGRGKLLGVFAPL